MDSRNKFDRSRPLQNYYVAAKKCLQNCAKGVHRLKNFTLPVTFIKNKKKFFSGCRKKSTKLREKIGEVKITTSTYTSTVREQPGFAPYSLQTTRGPPFFLIRAPFRSGAPFGRKCLLIFPLNPVIYLTWRQLSRYRHRCIFLGQQIGNPLFNHF